jgi:hypothetical protein
MKLLLVAGFVLLSSLSPLTSVLPQAKEGKISWVGRVSEQNTVLFDFTKTTSEPSGKFDGEFPQNVTVELVDARNFEGSIGVMGKGAGLLEVQITPKDKAQNVTLIFKWQRSSQ